MSGQANRKMSNFPIHYSRCTVSRVFEHADQQIRHCNVCYFKILGRNAPVNIPGYSRQLCNFIRRRPAVITSLPFFPNFYSPSMTVSFEWKVGRFQNIKTTRNSRFTQSVFSMDPLKCYNRSSPSFL